MQEVVDPQMEKIKKWAHESVVCLMVMNYSTKEKGLFGSGLLIQIEKGYYLLTAAHVLEEIITFLQGNSDFCYNVQGMFQGPNHEYLQPERIMVDGLYQGDSKLIDLSYGRDVAIVSLSHICTENLKHEGLVFRNEDVLNCDFSVPDDQKFGFWVAGYPKNMVGENIGFDFDIHLGIYPASNMTLDERVTGLVTIQDDPDVKGVSGGPVLALWGENVKLVGLQVSQQNNPRRYRIVGIDRVRAYWDAVRDVADYS
jgi:hypothetical protein